MGIVVVPDVGEGVVGLGGLVRKARGDDTLWGVDLRSVGGFAEAVTEHLERSVRDGPAAALEAHLNGLNRRGPTRG